MTYSKECEEMIGGGPLVWNVCELYTRYCEFSKSLEGDCGLDTMPSFNAISRRYTQ